MSFIEKKGLKISSILFDFVNKEIIPGTDIQTDKFWDGFEKTVHQLAPINKRLIEKRETIQKQILILKLLKLIMRLLQLQVHSLLFQ